VTFNIRDEDGYSCTGCQSEREVVIDFRRERGIVATLYNHLGSLPERLARLKVWRPTERTVAFAVRKRQLQRGAYSSYEWGVEAVYEKQGDETCPLDHACRDLAPNGRYDLLRHDL
jgi:hypothetical protein